MELEAPGRTKQLAMERAAVRLGHDAFVSGRLTRPAMSAALRALASFRDSMKQLGITHHRAVATSAVRESRNGEQFVALVRRQTGLTLDVISGPEEARLILIAVREKIPLGTGRWVLVDLGGGSAEVSLADASGILWCESHAIGSVRLLEELGQAGDEPGRFRDLLAEYVGTLAVRLSADRERIAGVIATGGNIDTLARLAGRSGGDGVVVLPLSRLRAIVQKLSVLSYRQRMKELGLRADRADVILPAALVYERVCVLAGKDEILVPFVGLKDGVLLDLVDDLVAHREHSDRQDQESIAAAVALGRRYDFDEAHGLHVARLARSLFDQLVALHGLGAAERRMLLAAAVLHEIGQYVSFRKHHKHSFYLISESELPGFTALEMRITGNLARYHRGSEPSPRHEPYARLGRPEREVVRKLGAILRMADALDREHSQRVQQVEIRATRRKASLRLRGRGDLLLERWALKKKCGLFSQVFGLRVELQG